MAVVCLYGAGKSTLLHPPAINPLPLTRHPQNCYCEGHDDDLSVSSVWDCVSVGLCVCVCVCVCVRDFVSSVLVVGCGICVQ